MATSEEKFQARQQELLELSRRLIIEEGYSNFSIERIASASGYSRPTVYQHFGSKTEAIAAIGERMLDTATGLMSPLAKADGNGRERCLALLYGYELFARFYPEDFYLEDLFGYRWFRDMLPQSTVERYRGMVDFFHAHIRDAVSAAAEAGELELPAAGPDAAALAYIIPGKLFGLYAGVTKSHLLFIKANLSDPWTPMRRSMNETLDGMRWHPLGCERDYEAHYQSTLKRLYPKYWLRVQTEALAREVGLDGDPEVGTRQGAVPVFS